MAAALLTKLGYRVTVCNNGKEALEMYKEASPTIDLVVLDLVMPEMGGSEIFLKLLEINPLVRVLLVSGYSVNEDVQRILDAGAKDFVQKPFTMVQLSRKIAEVLKP